MKTESVMRSNGCETKVAKKLGRVGLSIGSAGGAKGGWLRDR